MNKTERQTRELVYRQTELATDKAASSASTALRVKNGTAWAVELLMHAIRQERQKQGLTLDEVALRCGINKSILSKLENGKLLNAQVDTLMRIALSLGKVVGLQLQDGTKPIVKSNLDRAGVAAYLAQRKAATAIKKTPSGSNGTHAPKPVIERKAFS